MLPQWSKPALISATIQMEQAGLGGGASVPDGARRCHGDSLRQKLGIAAVRFPHILWSDPGHLGQVNSLYGGGGGMILFKRVRLERLGPKGVVQGPGGDVTLPTVGFKPAMF